ncbi:hypothetical protein KXV47_002300 [Aspergillus fumigatus]|nr:hypothetical protein KXV47_002300 [Aspergillus fumigatus]
MEATSVYGIAAGGFFIALVSVRLVSLLLSLINMAVLFAGSPLVYLADIIGVSLRASRRIHRAAGWMSGMLLACHVTIMVIMKWRDFHIQKIDNIFAIIGAGVLGAILFFSLPFLRCHAYEVFLRVISWSNEEQDTLELFVQPWRGFLADLLRAAEDGPVSFPAYITGPHGTSELVDQYESVLAIATDFGVAAVIPYFRKLIDNCNKSVARARRLHFVWQVQTRDDAIAGESLLNSLLEDDEDDILHKRSILTISLFVKSGPAENILFLGDHERAFIHCEEPNYREIIEVEASGQYITRLSNSEEARGEPLVMVT